MEPSSIQERNHIRLFTLAFRGQVSYASMFVGYEGLLLGSVFVHLCTFSFICVWAQTRLLNVRVKNEWLE